MLTSRKTAILKQLLKEYENIIYQYKVRLSPAALILTDSTTTLGYWKKTERVIGISLKLIEKYHWRSVVQVLKHEIAHQIADEILGGHHNHDKIFHLACEKIYVEPWARSANVELDASQPDLKQASAQNRDKQNLERKVERLLNLANSQNEHEASLALAKANQLREKYKLDNLSPYTESEIYSLVIRTGKRRLDNSYTFLVKILTSFFGVKAIFTEEFNAADQKEYKTIEMIGYSKDLIIAEYVYNFLLRQVELLWLDHKKKNLENKVKLSPAVRNAFRLGILVGINNKLERSMASEKIDDRFWCKLKSFSSDFPLLDKTRDDNSGKITELARVNAINEEVISKVFNKKFPRVSSKINYIGGRDPKAFAAGRTLGSKINITAAFNPTQKTTFING